MPFTTVAFAAEGAAGGPFAALTPLPALADQHVNFGVNTITVPMEVASLAGISAIGDTLAAARVQSPSLLAMMAPDVAPFDTAVATPADPSAFVDMMENPIPLAPSEQLQGLAITGGADTESIGCWLADRAIVPYRGPYTSLQGANAVALVADVWSARVMVWGQVIPAGLYACVGLKPVSVTNRIGRLIFPAGSWRPGAPGTAALAIRGSFRFRFGNPGVMGQFKHDQPPQVEHYADLADAANAAVLDVVKVG